MYKRQVQGRTIQPALKRRRSIVHYLKENWVFYLFILPAFLDILIFWYFPLYGIQISFRDYKIRRGMTGSEWVGLEYFVQFIESPNFVQLMRKDVYKRQHMVKPALVYISNTTEVGTVYTEAEIEAIGACCRENELLLYVDGARMGSAIAAGGASLQTLARCADAFTIGGTKNGALFGEAMVLVNPSLTRDFRYIMKQRGAMLAKGWLLGAQFAALFQDNLYFDMAAHANAMAQKLARGLAAKGYEFLYPPVSNQLFPIMRDDTAQRLMKRAQFQRTQPLGDGESVWRFVTSWSTQEEMCIRDRVIRF